MIYETAVNERFGNVDLMSREELIERYNAYVLYCHYFMEEAMKWEGKYNSLISKLGGILEDNSADSVRG